MTKYFIAFIEANPVALKPKVTYGNATYQTELEEFSEAFIAQFKKDNPYKTILFIKKLSNRKEENAHSSGPSEAKD